MAGQNGQDRGATPPDRAQGAPPPGTGPPHGARPPEGAPPPAGPEPGAAPHAAPTGHERPAPPSPSGEPPAGEPTAPETAEPARTEPAAAEPAGTGMTPARPAEPATEPSALAAELDAKVAALEDRWLRAVADLDNLRKRMLRDMERARAEERARVAGEFLPVLDNLDRALEHADAEPTAVIDGVRAIRAQAIDVMARLGFPRQEDEGAPFDPTRHEAVSTIADPAAKPGTVAKVLRPGYGEPGGGVLRPAMVVVATEAGQDRT
jgi:molecular chaperone GrpE